MPSRIKGTPDIGEEIDALFRLPLAEFTAARNALAAKLRKDGRTDDAERVKGMAKPPVSAWAVNQLYWQNPRDIEELLAMGNRLRKAQVGRSGDLRSLLDQKKQVLSALMARVSALLGQSGQPASPDMLRRVATTLESLAAWSGTEGAPQAGRLTADLDPPGFESLAALMSGGKTAKVLPFRTGPVRKDKETTRAEARERVQAAEKALREARSAAKRAEAAQEKAVARAGTAETQSQELEKRYAQARQEAQAASREARRAAEEAKQAAQAVTEAERKLEKARAALDQ